MPSCGAREQVLDGTILSSKPFFAEEWWGKFRISRRSTSNQLTKWKWIRVRVDKQVRFEYATFERGNFWIQKEKFADSIISRYVWALEKRLVYRKLTGCHGFSCRPVLLISCVVVRSRCVQKWILLEWLFSLLPFLVFPTQGMHAITDTKWSLVISLSVCYHHQHHRRHFRCRSRHHRHRHFHHHRHHGRHHHHYHYFFKIMLHLIWHYPGSTVKNTSIIRRQV